MEAKKPLVVVMSRNHATGLGVVRALGSAGYTVDLISSSHRTGASNYVAKSKYVRNHKEVVSNKKDDLKDHVLLETLNGYIESNYNEKIVLLPTDDFTSAVVDMNRDFLKQYFVLPHIAENNEGEMIEHMDYFFQKSLAQRCGFKSYREWIIDLKKIEIPKELKYPCVCVPCDYVTSNDKEWAAFEDESSLKIHLNQLRRRNADRIVAIHNILDADSKLEINGICFGDEIIIPAIVEYMGYAQYNRTVEMNGKIVPVSEYEQEYNKTVELLKTLDLTGMFCLELDIINGVPYFNRLYLRCSKVIQAYYKAGANLPVAYVQKRLNGEISIDLEVSKAESFVLDNVVRKDFRMENIDNHEMKKILKDNKIKIIYDEDDPAPAIMLTSDKYYFRRTSLKKKIKKLIKRYIFPILRPVKHLIWQYPQTDNANERNPKAELPRIIVSGRNYGSNLCIARAIGKAGYEVEVLRIFHRKPRTRQLLKKMIPDAYSKYIKAFWTCVYGGKSWRVVNRLIQIADPNRKMLIVPADDLMACILDDYYDELSQYFILPNVNNKSGEINRLMSKSVQKELAIKAGLPVVNSCIIKTENGKFDIPDTVSYPCFIKPNISKNGSKTKMRKCASEKELHDALTELGEVKDVEMLVEDFVEIGREFSILGVSTKNGAIGPGFFGAEEGGQAEHRGVAITGQVLPCDISPEWKKLIDDSVKFVGSLGYDGLYDIDYIETVDGKLYFVEVNMRFGGSGYAITESGVNLPGMFADYMLLGKPIDMDVKVEKTGKRFVSEKVLIEEYVKNRITMKRLKQIMDDVDIHFIKCDDDTNAYNHFKKFYPIASMLRFIYRIKDGTDSEFGK